MVAGAKPPNYEKKKFILCTEKNMCQMRLTTLSCVKVKTGRRGSYGALCMIEGIAEDGR